MGMMNASAVSDIKVWPADYRGARLELVPRSRRKRDLEIVVSFAVVVSVAVC